MSWHIHDLKKRHLIFCLLHTRGNVAETARLLGLTDKSVHHWLRDFSLERLLMLLRSAVARGEPIKTPGLKEYARHNAAFDEIISKTMVQVNQSIDVDFLLKEIRDLKFIYAQTLEEHQEEDFRARPAYPGGKFLDGATPPDR